MICFPMQIHRRWIYQIEAFRHGFGLQLWNPGGEHLWKVAALPSFAEAEAFATLVANAEGEALDKLLDQFQLVECDDCLYQGWLIHPDEIFCDEIVLYQPNGQKIHIFFRDESVPEQIERIKAAIDNCEWSLLEG